MKITKVCVVDLLGHPDESYNEYAQPFAYRAERMDVFPQFPKRRKQTGFLPHFKDDGSIELQQQFVKIETDEGICGYAGPIQGQATALYILRHLRKICEGHSPWETEYLWEAMYRTNYHGRAGEYILAISYIDIALWDIKCKAAGVPLHDMLGGVCQPSVPAYANMIGYAFDLDVLLPAIRNLMDKNGVRAFKIEAETGPAEGDAGMRQMLKTIEGIRAEVGDDVKLMVDPIGVWNMTYCQKIIPRLQELGIHWLEEAIDPANQEGAAELVRTTPFLYANGEHEYTRWGFRDLIMKNAADIYMPEPSWAGGISETIKIAALLIAHRKKISFHNCLTSLGVSFSVAHPADYIEMCEYVAFMAPAFQYFVKEQSMPKDGIFVPITENGVGLTLDMDKIDKITELE